MFVWAQNGIKQSLQFLKTIKSTIIHLWKPNLRKHLVSCSLGTQVQDSVGSMKIVTHVFSPISVTEKILIHNLEKNLSDDLSSHISSVATYLYNLRGQSFLWTSPFHS